MSRIVRNIIRDIRYNNIHRNYMLQGRLIDSVIYTQLKQNKKCSRCGRRFDRLEIHHKIPVHKGGTNERDNLLTLCTKCHKFFHTYL